MPVALVTGGTRGIGAGVARAFLRGGYDVAVTGRTPPSEGSAGATWYIEADSRDPVAVEAAVHSAVDRYGRLDCLVNNAARFQAWLALDQVPLEEIRAIIETNVLGYVAGCRAALPALRLSRGSIINIGSLTGEIGNWHASVYVATKGAVTALTKALAIDEADAGVRVNALLPGNVYTDAREALEAASGRPEELHAFLESHQWAGRSATEDEVGELCVFLASDLAAYLTGVTLPVSGGAELGYGPKRPYPDFGRRG